ncbi:hypothetical protein FGO68_gene11721 [Halteria grandinella]|uniref:Uncharacterized protein n=1 Tax=Halteria grandinella TaxID=5974 RepID=A0A8J8NBW8_HALGN|nr:hypothetical protein FGO68_gene11721 [Halteria grandinella]
MKKKLTKSKFLVHQNPPTIETPRFKEKASQLSQPSFSPQKIGASEYFSFGGLDEPLQQPPLKKTSKSVFEHNGKPKQINNSFERRIVTSKSPKVQIFNNNYQIININQIDKKESIRSLQKQFQQILDNSAQRKLATPIKTSQSPQPMNSAKTPSSASSYFNVSRLKKPTLTRKKN